MTSILPSAQRALTPIADRLLWSMIAASTIILPCFISPDGKDIFRDPKSIFFRAEALTIAAALLIGWVWRQTSFRVQYRELPPLICAAVVLWTAVTLFFSSNRVLSSNAFWRVCGVVLLFLVTYELAKRRSFTAVFLPMIPAAINAALALLQELRIWNPFILDPIASPHEQSTALLGNPNDVGTYLVVPALAAIPAALATKRHRAWVAALAFFLAAALVSTVTLTALAAYAVGVATLAIVVDRRNLLAIAIVLIFSVILGSSYAPIRARIFRITSALQTGNIDAALSSRITPFLAAWQMGISSPLTGVGPGTFGWQYFPFKLRVEASHPELRLAGARTLNFGEVHNDQLELFAEGGVPSYILFLLALVTLALPTLRGQTSPGLTTDRQPPSSRKVFARLLGLPFAAAMFVLTLAQFPLQLTAPTMTFTYFAALVLAWEGGPS